MLSEKLKDRFKVSNTAHDRILVAEACSIEAKLQAAEAKVVELESNLASSDATVERLHNRLILFQGEPTYEVLLASYTVAYETMTALQAEVARLTELTKPTAANHWHDKYQEASTRIAELEAEVARLAEKLKEPQRDWPEHFHLENGNYQCKCLDCGEFFTAHKRSICCRTCWLNGSEKHINELHTRIAELEARLREAISSIQAAPRVEEPRCDCQADEVHDDHLKSCPTHQEQLDATLNHTLDRINGDLRARIAELEAKLAEANFLLDDARECRDSFQAARNEHEVTISAQAEETERLTEVYILGNRDLRARVVDLETAILNWYEWSTNDSINDDPIDTINEIARLMLDKEPRVNL